MKSVVDVFLENAMSTCMVIDKRGYVLSVDYGRTHDEDYDDAEVLEYLSPQQIRTNGAGIIKCDFEADSYNLTTIFRQLIPTGVQIGVNGEEPSEWYSEENLAAIAEHRGEDTYFFVTYDVEKHCFCIIQDEEE